MTFLNFFYIHVFNTRHHLVNSDLTYANLFLSENVDVGDRTLHTLLLSLVAG